MKSDEFFDLFNSIDDKFIEEQQQDISSGFPVVTMVNPERKNNFKQFMGLAAGFLVVLGVTAVCLLLNNGFGITPALPGTETAAKTEDHNNTFSSSSSPVTSVSDNNSQTSAQTSPITQTPAQTEKPNTPIDKLLLYETELHKEGKTYQCKAYLTKVADPEGFSINKNYYYGTVVVELYNGEKLINSLEAYGYQGLASNPFPKDSLGRDYFKVLPMKQDVLVYATPNVRLNETENDKSITNAVFLTVDNNGELVQLRRFSTEEEKEELGVNYAGELNYTDGCLFKLTHDYTVEENRIVCHLNDTVKNPWATNRTVFEKGDIPLSFDFDNNIIKCEIDDYKYLIYHLTANPITHNYNLTLINGEEASKDEILHVDTNTWQVSDIFSVNVSFGVPFFTPAKDRVAGEKGDWVKLKQGDTIGGFKVTDAYSIYPIIDNGSPVFPDYYQTNVGLEGDLTCTGTAKKYYNHNGSYDGQLILTLDKESCKKLFSLRPHVKAIDRDFINSYPFDPEEERINILIPSDTKGTAELFSALNYQDLVKFKVNTDKFSLSFSFETGYTHDGSTLLIPSGKTSFEVLE